MMGLRVSNIIFKHVYGRLCLECFAEWLRTFFQSLSGTHFVPTLIEGMDWQG